MTGKAKAKGNSGERELCTIFGKVFGGNFMRVPNSGAYIGGKNSGRKAQMSTTQIAASKGDIIPPDHMPKLVLECKFYADFGFHLLITGGKVPQLDKWIEQTVECVEDGDLWFVAFKINRKGWFICYPHELAPKVAVGNHAVYNDGKKSFVVTELTKFVADNKDVILDLSK